MTVIFEIEPILMKISFFELPGSEKQKAGTERVLRFLIEKKPNQYSELQAKYDPEGIYYAKFKKEAEARGIKV